MNFDFIAPIYDHLVRWIFGSVLNRSRRLLLEEITAIDQTLIIGGGSGDMLFGLAERQISKEVVYLEASKRFIDFAQFRWQQDGSPPMSPPIWLNDTWETYQPTAKFDLITTDYLLDLFPEDEVNKLVCKLRLWLKPDGHWLYVDFCQNEQTAWWWKPTRWLMYRFFGLLAGVPGRKISDVRAIAAKHGFQIAAQSQMAQHGIEAIIFRL